MTSKQSELKMNWLNSDDLTLEVPVYDDDDTSMTEVSKYWRMVRKK